MHCAYYSAHACLNSASPGYARMKGIRSIRLQSIRKLLKSTKFVLEDVCYSPDDQWSCETRTSPAEMKPAAKTVISQEPLLCWCCFFAEMFFKDQETTWMWKYCLRHCNFLSKKTSLCTSSCDTMNTEGKDGFRLWGHISVSTTIFCWKLFSELLNNDQKTYPIFECETLHLRCFWSVVRHSWIHTSFCNSGLESLLR